MSSHKLVSALSTSSKPQNSLYVALGIHELEAGYSIVSEATESIGIRTPLTSSFWHIHTTYNLQSTFNVINTSMLDRRINSYSSLVVLNPSNGMAKWHLRQPLSDLISAHWNYQNNIFISFNLQAPTLNYNQLTHSITQLGIWAPLTRDTWYLSTPSPSKDVFKSLLDHLCSGDQLCVFDSHGHIASWYNDTSSSLCA